MEEQTIKGIIFDKDGTLFNYAQVWRSVIKKIVNSVMITFEIERKKQDKAKADLFRIIGVDASGKSYSDGIVFNHNRKLRAFNRLFTFCLRYHINPVSFTILLTDMLKDPSEGITGKLKAMDFSDVQQLFKELTEKNVVIGIVTNDTTISTKNCLKCMGIESYVSFLRTKDSNCKGKPDSQSIRQFCSQFMLTPQEVCVVGDTITDMKYGINGEVGLKIAVLSGPGDEDSLSKLADKVYPDISALLQDYTLFPEKMPD